MSNSRLIAEFINHTEWFDVTWNEEKNEIDFYNISEKLFISPNDTVRALLDNEEFPEMMIYWNENPDVKSQVLRDRDDYIYPVRSLNEAKEKLRTKKQ